MEGGDQDFELKFIICLGKEGVRKLVFHRRLLKII